MADSKILVFFRIDNPKIKEQVEGLGKVVSLEETGGIDRIGMELNLNYLPSCPCIEGSPKAMELAADDMYVVRELRYD